MTSYVGYAPGKIILFGEHAVVYGQPALAVPVHQVKATAIVEDAPPGSGLLIHAEDLSISLSLTGAASHALVVTARLVLEKLNQPEPDAQITIRSTIPIASGLGSGAAVSAALARALAGYLGQDLPTPELSALVYEVEKLYHGTPSGIDNTVVCFGQPVYFVRDGKVEPFEIKAPIHLVIGDTGIASPTHAVVRDVRIAQERDCEAYASRFAQIGSIARQARECIEKGQIGQLGPLMTENQRLLEQLDVSSIELRRLINATTRAGALGAKLSGGGRGGNMIALINPGQEDEITAALYQAGATNVISSTVPATVG